MLAHESNTAQATPCAATAATPATAATAVRRVGLAVDGSADSKHALEWALENVFRAGDFVYLLHVIPHEETAAGVYPGGLQAYGAVFLSEQFNKMREEAEANARTILKQYGHSIKEKHLHIQGIEGEIMKGSPREELVDAVERFKLDLLVVGSRGLGVIKRSLVGSVSDFCVHHAACPVIVVRPRAEAK